MMLPMSHLKSRGKLGHLLASYVISELHTCRISDVESVLCLQLAGKLKQSGLTSRLLTVSSVILITYSSRLVGFVRKWSLSASLLVACVAGGIVRV